jgi:hypothetical protein
MTYAARSPAGFGAFTGQAAGDAAKPGLLRRLYDSFVAARQKSADDELNRYFARHGRLLTDEIERDMMRRTISNNWSARG